MSVGFRLVCGEDMMDLRLLGGGSSPVGFGPESSTRPVRLRVFEATARKIIKPHIRALKYPSLQEAPNIESAFLRDSDGFKVP